MLNKIPDLKMVSRDWSVGPSKNRPSCIYKLGKHIIREFCISYLFDAGESTSNSQKKLDLVMNLIDEEIENLGDLLKVTQHSKATSQSKTP